jgi:hypothetical protein
MYDSRMKQDGVIVMNVNALSKVIALSPFGEVKLSTRFPLVIDKKNILKNGYGLSRTGCKSWIYVQVQIYSEISFYLTGVSS